MKEVLLIASVSAVFLFGFYIMKRIDIFLAENYNDMPETPDTTEPSFIMLAGELSEEEVVQELHHFREKHKSVKVLIYDETTIKLTVKNL